MYMTFRQMKADPARLQDALGLMEFVVGRLNDEHGGSFGYSMQVGGDPSLVALSSPWETLGRYQAMREAIATDPELQSAIRLASDLFTDAQDMIGKVLNPPGERGAFVEINTARIHMPAVAEAMAFCQEVVEFAEGKTGRPLGLIAGHTGDRSQIAFVAYGDSLDHLETLSDQVEGDADFQTFYKRSEDLIVAGSAERNYWQLLG